MANFVGAVDQGTTSTRFIVFDRNGMEVGSHQSEHRQILPAPGFVEHDPVEIWERTAAVIATTLDGLGLNASDLAAVGITNQRETTVVWNRRTGHPFCNAIVWQDTRTADRIDAMSEEQCQLIRDKTGLVPSTYASASKLQWIIEHVEGVRDNPDAVFGTMDSWLLWNLTGGAHVTDVTNASRTMLFDIASLDWDDELLAIFGVPRAMLPQVHASSDTALYGATVVDGPFRGAVPLASALGDQQAALLGQVCTQPGEAKNTYGTGSFLLLNTGSDIVRSSNGLLTTVAFGFDKEPVSYALEGAIAVTGSAVQWLRDQLGIIKSAADVETLAGSVPDSGGMYFVPAFSGLFAPYWRADARGVIVGMSRYNTNAHLARATLEAIAFQTRDVVDAMTVDAGMSFSQLRVDGGASRNNLLMQIQADVLGIPVCRPVMTETTALGAAYAVGLAVGFWKNVDELRQNWKEDRSWTPRWTDDERAERYASWKKAVARTLDWA